MSRIHRRLCRSCREWFEPDCRHVKDQHFCANPECRKASHRHSHHKWLKRNPGFYSGNEHVLRVRAWRQEHPDSGGGVRPGRTINITVLITDIDSRTLEIHARCHDHQTGALQDQTLTQPAVSKRIALMLEGALHDPMGFRFLNYYRTPSFKSRMPVKPGKRHKSRWRRHHGCPPRGDGNGLRKTP